jgi:hypothetical protein
MVTPTRHISGTVCGGPRCRRNAGTASRRLGPVSSYSGKNLGKGRSAAHNLWFLAARQRHAKERGTRIEVIEPSVEELYFL